MSDTTNQVMGSTQSFANKVWHWLGFYGRFDEVLFDWRQSVYDDPTKPELITSETHIKFSFLDRLRVLFSGHVVLTTYIKADGKELPIRTLETRSEVAVWP